MEQLLLKPMECAQALGLGRSKMYELLATGEIETIRLGPRSIRIPYRALSEWVESQRRGTGSPEQGTSEEETG